MLITMIIILDFSFFLLLQKENIITSRRSTSSHWSHSSGSLHGSRSSRYTNMSEEEFEEETKWQGWKRWEWPCERSDKGESTKKDSGCFDSCFGWGGVRRKEIRRSSLPPVREDDGESTFSFQPRTQPQNVEQTTTTENSPVRDTPKVTPIKTPVETPRIQSIYDLNR